MENYGNVERLPYEISREERLAEIPRDAELYEPDAKSRDAELEVGMMEYDKIITRPAALPRPFRDKLARLEYSRRIPSAVSRAEICRIPVLPYFIRPEATVMGAFLIGSIAVLALTWSCFGLVFALPFIVPVIVMILGLTTLLIVGRLMLSSGESPE